jgi:hypothetical protein
MVYITNAESITNDPFAVYFPMEKYIFDILVFHHKFPIILHKKQKENFWKINLFPLKKDLKTKFFLPLPFSSAVNNFR